MASLPLAAWILVSVERQRPVVPSRSVHRSSRSAAALTAVCDSNFRCSVFVRLFISSCFPSLICFSLSAGQMVTLTLCLLGTDKRHHRWLWYVILGLTVDHITRILAGPRAGLVTLFGDFVDAIMSHCRTASAPRGFFPRSIVAGAPYQFSDFCSFILLGAAVICFFDGDVDGDSDTAGAVLLAIQALFSFIELFFGFNVFVWFFNQMVGLNGHT